MHPSRVREASSRTGPARGAGKRAGRARREACRADASEGQASHERRREEEEWRRGKRGGFKLQDGVGLLRRKRWSVTLGACGQTPQRPRLIGPERGAPHTDLSTRDTRRNHSSRSSHDRHKSAEHIDLEARSPALAASSSLLALAPDILLPSPSAPLVSHHLLPAGVVLPPGSVCI